MATVNVPAGEVNAFEVALAATTEPRVTKEIVSKSTPGRYAVM